MVGVAIALVISYTCRRFVKEILTDERNKKIDERATVLSYRIYTIGVAVFALVVLLLRSSLPSWLSLAGETLAYALCGLMLLHSGATWYCRRRL